MKNKNLDTALGLTPCDACIGGQTKNDCECVQCQGKDYGTENCFYTNCPFKGDKCDQFKRFEDST